MQFLVDVKFFYLPLNFGLSLIKYKIITRITKYSKEKFPFVSLVSPTFNRKALNS